MYYQAKLGQKRSIIDAWCVFIVVSFQFEKNKVIRVKSHNWKSNYFSKLELEIDKIKEEGHYRVFNNIERKAGQFPKATRHNNGQTEEIDVWCSND